MTHQTHPDKDTIWRFANQRSAMDVVVAGELHRAHIDPHHIVWECLSCRASMSCVSRDQLPAPADLEHEPNCPWLTSWLDFSENLRTQYCLTWLKRRNAHRHELRAGLTPTLQRAS